jgi:hypothetical protein
MLYKQYKFGRNRSVINGTLVEVEIIIRLYLAWQCRGVTEASRLCLTTHGLQEV